VRVERKAKREREERKVEQPQERGPQSLRLPLRPRIDQAMWWASEQGWKRRAPGNPHSKVCSGHREFGQFADSAPLSSACRLSVSAEWHGLQQKVANQARDLLQKHRKNEGKLWTTPRELSHPGAAHRSGAAHQAECM